MERDLRRSACDFGHVGHLWGGKLLSAHFPQRYQVTLGVRQCQRIFGQTGFRLRKPRPQVTQADPVPVGEVCIQLVRNVRDVSQIVARQRTRGKRMVIVLDNVRYHYATLLAPLLQEHLKELTLLFLSPYSPQLASIERVWKLTRRLATHNRYFETLGEVLEDVQEYFARWKQMNMLLTGLRDIT